MPSAKNEAFEPANAGESGPTDRADLAAGFADAELAKYQLNQSKESVKRLTINDVSGFRTQNLVFRTFDVFYTLRYTNGRRWQSKAPLPSL